MNKSIISVDKLKLQKEFLENEIIFIKRKFKILESENILFSVWTNKFLFKGFVFTDKGLYWNLNYKYSKNNLSNEIIDCIEKKYVESCEFTYNKILPEIDGKYFIFIGENQQKIPREFVFPKEKKELVAIKGNGKNALDFHIVYFLSKNDEKEDIEHYILSKDSGYDPLIAYCKDEKKVVKRITSIDEINNSKKDINENTQKNLDGYLKHLEKIPRNRYPKSENGLKKDIGSSLGKKLTNEQIEDVIKLMYMKTYIGKNGNNITYKLPN